MSEEDDQLITGQGSALAEELEDFTSVSEPIDDFEQNGLLLKIAVNGITVQDYVKKLQESDILVAVDGKYIEMGLPDFGRFSQTRLEKKRNGSFLFIVTGKFLIFL